MLAPSQLCLTLWGPMDFEASRFLCPWNFPGENIEVGYHFLKSLQPRGQGCISCISCIAGGFFTTMPFGKLVISVYHQSNEETKQKLFLDSQRKKLRLMVIKWLGIYTAEGRACTRNWAFTFKIAISQGRRLGGATPRLRSRVVAKRSKSTSKERWLRGCRRA